jgi:hypothetical protein
MAVEHIKFFEKNKADLSYTAAIATASQGDEYADLARNRANTSAWVTSGSVDADNTTYELDFVDSKVIDTLILAKHNFKNYTFKYWDGAAYQDVSPAVAVTNNTSETTSHSFTSVETTKVKVTITGTMTANQDKFLYQFIVTKLLGELSGWPVIKNANNSRSRIRNKMLSGKESISEQVGVVSFRLDQKIMKDDDDITLVENLFFSNEGFLVWLSGGLETQFSNVIRTYRNEDIFLMKCSNEYKPDLYQGIYSAGIHVVIDLVEVVD